MTYRLTIVKSVVIIVALTAVVATFKAETKPVDPELAKKRSDQYAAVEYAKIAIPKKLKDPASATFGKIDAYADRKWRGANVTAVSGAVNAGNGFGGYTGMRDFVFIAEKNFAVFNSEGDNSEFVSLWNALCAGKHS